MFHIELGLRHSRLDKLGAAALSKLQEMVELDDVTEATGYGLPEHTDLRKNGVINFEGGD
jgi:hypothetical protein